MSIGNERPSASGAPVPGASPAPPSRRADEAWQGPSRGGWTPEKVARLSETYHTTAPRLIAAELGFSRDAVIGKAYRLGLCDKKPDALHREERLLAALAAAKGETVSTAALMRATGITHEPSFKCLVSGVRGMGHEIEIDYAIGYRLVTRVSRHELAKLRTVA